MGNHYAILDHQVMGGQECLNVYCYEVTDGVTTALDVADSWRTEVMDHIKDMQNVTVTHTLIDVINLDDLSDFITVISDEPGIVTGDALPVHDAFSIMFPRTTRASRNGWKRIPGVSESDQSGGALNAGAISNLEAVAAFIDGPFTTGITSAEMTHRLWRRERRDPDTGAIVVAQAFFPLGPGVAQVTVSSQNTRKPGRGA